VSWAYEEKRKEIGKKYRGKKQKGNEGEGFFMRKYVDVPSLERWRDPPPPGPNNVGKKKKKKKKGTEKKMGV